VPAMRSTSRLRACNCSREICWTCSSKPRLSI
jgi:hypothetical protein